MNILLSQTQTKLELDPTQTQLVYFYFLHLRRFADPETCYKLILMTTKGLCGTHIVDVKRTVMLR